jgi:hypothetical protein
MLKDSLSRATRFQMIQGGRAMWKYVLNDQQQSHFLVRHSNMLIRRKPGCILRYQYWQLTFVQKSSAHDAPCLFL